MDPDIFLSRLAARRRREQALSMALNPPDSSTLHPDLRVAIRHRLLVQPVLGAYTNNRTCIGEPDNRPEVLASWAATYTDCNWAVLLGAEAGVFAVEINPSICLDAIAWITYHDGRDWQRTLQFRCGRLHYALFRWPADGICQRGHLPGMTLHGRNRILIPPAARGRGDQLTYIDRSAPILEAPISLFRSPFGGCPEPDANDLFQTR